MLKTSSEEGSTRNIPVHLETGAEMLSAGVAQAFQAVELLDNDLDSLFRPFLRILEFYDIAAQTALVLLLCSNLKCSI